MEFAGDGRDADAAVATFSWSWLCNGRRRKWSRKLLSDLLLPSPDCSGAGCLPAIAEYGHEIPTSLAERERRQSPCSLKWRGFRKNGTFFFQGVSRTSDPYTDYFNSEISVLACHNLGCRAPPRHFNKSDQEHFLMFPPSVLVP